MFIEDFPIKTSIYKGFSMAMLHNQMVYSGNLIRTRYPRAIGLRKLKDDSEGTESKAGPTGRSAEALNGWIINGEGIW